MITLGHIEYSNCFPVHALLVGDDVPAGIRVVSGTPSHLNHLLETGQIDVAPCSSIEYARHANDYRLLPEFVIGSDGPIGSILFETPGAIEDLDGRTVMLPTASATSIVLLKILLRLKYGVTPHYDWFAQSDSADPFAEGADAALWIGDVALRRRMPETHRVLDLGAEWREWTGLPFAFAVWQTSAPAARDPELRDLLGHMRSSYAYFKQNSKLLAEQHAATFGIPAPRLQDYWASLRYELDAPMQRGLLKYYELAAQLGEAPSVSRLQWVL